MQRSAEDKPMHISSEGKTESQLRREIINLHKNSNLNVLVVSFAGKQQWSMVDFVRDAIDSHSELKNSACNIILILHSSPQDYLVKAEKFSKPNLECFQSHWQILTVENLRGDDPETFFKKLSKQPVKYLMEKEDSTEVLNEMIARQL